MQQPRSRRLPQSVRWILGACILVGQSAEASQPQLRPPINSGTSTYDSHPSVTIAPDGCTWVAWHGYGDGRDQVLVRRIDPSGGHGETYSVSGPTVAAGPPVMVAGPEYLGVLWSEFAGNRWQLRARRFVDGVWLPAVPLSDSGSHAIHPAASSTNDGRLHVAWSDARQRRFRIVHRVFQGGNWQPPLAISNGEHDAWRPQITVEANGEAWAVWDEYHGDHYAVQVRQCAPRLSGIEQITPRGEHCLNAAALATPKGLYVAWLRKRDVMGGEGVISQLHTLHAARRASGGWSQISDAAGNDTAVELTQGLMAKIAPRPVPTGGYLGRRTEPLLAAAGEQIWLLWERKHDHLGRTWQVHGDLLGRPIDGERWGNPVTLHTGMLDYHVHNSDTAVFQVLASRLPRRTRRYYYSFSCELRETSEFQQDHWEGWSPLTLPIEEELPPRHTISADGEQLQLYWADLHCHNGLTADAEGQPDELMVYARDRARLDVVVFTNNDFLYDVPLTQYEYHLGSLLAKIFTRSDFLALPGYEWTSRLPGIAGARSADPGNWTPPYRNKSYPNHRSVVFPHQGGPLLRYPEVKNDISKLNAAVTNAGGVTLTQHDAFDVTGHPVEVAMELTSGWGRYIENRPELFHEPLNAGLKLGFVACGDTHRRAPGLSGALTGIYAEALTDKAILAALRARRCFATSGSRMMLDSRADGSLMGSELRAARRELTIELHAVGTRPILSATLIGSAGEIASYRGDGSRRLTVRHVENDLQPGTYWYYWRVAQRPARPDLAGNLNPAFGHLAWSSPHWVIVD